MPTTVPQICLGLTYDADTTATVNYTVGGPDVYTIPSSGVTRYNDRTGVAATDLLAFLAAEIQVDDIAANGAGNLWAGGEPSGDLLGRATLLNTARTDGRTVATVVLSGAGTRITGRDLGFFSDTMTFVAGISSGSYMRRRLWIPHRRDQIILSVSESHTGDDADVHGVSTRTPVHETQDDYGPDPYYLIEVDHIAGGCYLASYAAKSAYASEIGAAVSDPHVAFASFLKQWRDLTGTAKQARWSDDVDTPGTYVELLPRHPWVWAARVAMPEIQRSPDRYRLSIVCTEV